MTVKSLESDTMNRAIALAFTLMILAAPAAFAAPAPIPCYGIVLASPEVNGGAYGTSFSGRTTIDLRVSTLFEESALAKLSGAHSLEVRFLTPRGHVYQSTSVPFSPDAKLKGQKQQLSGYPRPVPYEMLTKVSIKNRKYFAATVKLPVGGTSITTNSMYGSWKARAFVDGSNTPCGPDATFTIAP